jgi:hypothetical protein
MVKRARRSSPKRAMKNLAAAALVAMTGVALVGVQAPATWALPIPGGYHDPVPGSSASPSAGFMAGNCDGQKTYVEGRYHLGTDWPARHGHDIHAIAAGTVTKARSWGSGWAEGVHILHTAGDGTRFAAAYGHLNLVPKLRGAADGTVVVSRGDVIGQVADIAADHLHFGIHPGWNVPADGWGMGVCKVEQRQRRGQPVWPDRNGYVDPLPFLREHPAEKNPTPPQPPTRIVSIRSNGNGQYVSAEVEYRGADYGMLRARAAGVGDWERFELVGDCAKRCTIRSLANRKFVSAELGYKGYAWGEMRARADSGGTWEQFRTEGDCARGCALRALGNNRLVSAELGYTGNGKGMLRARATSASAWEFFQMVAPPSQAAPGQPQPQPQPKPQPAPPPPPPPPPRPAIQLARGGPARYGSWYSVRLTAFQPGSRVTVTCHDSVDRAGFWNQTFTIDGAGNAADDTLCYSADGPDHWVTGGGVESNHVPW